MGGIALIQTVPSAEVPSTPRGAPSGEGRTTPRGYYRPSAQSPAILQTVIDEREMILRALEDGPHTAPLAEVRGVLLAEHVGRKQTRAL